jgi:hypothetical protein
MSDFNPCAVEVERGVNRIRLACGDCAETLWAIHPDVRSIAKCRKKNLRSIAITSFWPN